MNPILPTTSPLFNPAASAAGNTPQNHHQNNNNFLTDLQQALSAGRISTPQQVNAAALVTMITQFRAAQMAAAAAAHQQMQLQQQQQPIHHHHNPENSGGGGSGEICAPVPLIPLPQGLTSAFQQFGGGTTQQYLGSAPSAVEHDGATATFPPPPTTQSSSSPTSLMKHEETTIFDSSSTGENLSGCGDDLLLPGGRGGAESTENNFGGGNSPMLGYGNDNTLGYGNNTGGGDEKPLQSPSAEDSGGRKRVVPSRKRSRQGAGGVSNKTAEVWRYFDQIPTNEQITGQSARCRSCRTAIKTTNSSTTGMIRHLSSCHTKEFHELQVARIQKSWENKQNREFILQDFMNRTDKQSLEELPSVLRQITDFSSLQNIFETSINEVKNAENNCWGGGNSGDSGSGCGNNPCSNNNTTKPQQHPKHSVDSIIGGGGGSSDPAESEKIFLLINQYLKNYKKNIVKTITGPLASPGGEQQHHQQPPHQRKSQKRENTSAAASSPSLQNQTVTASAKRSVARKSPPAIGNSNNFLLQEKTIKSEHHQHLDSSADFDAGEQQHQQHLLNPIVKRQQQREEDEEQQQHQKIEVMDDVFVSTKDGKHQHHHQQQLQLQTPMLHAKIVKKNRKHNKPSALTGGGGAFQQQKPTAAAVEHSGKQIDNEIALMAILDNTAHILGMEGFRNLMHYAFPDYQMPAANIFHADIIPNVVHQKASGGGEYRRKQQQQFRSATTGGFNHHRHHDGCLDISPATTEESGFIDDNDGAGSEQSPQSFCHRRTSLSSSSTSTAKQQQHQSSTEFDDLLQHSIRSAQNISSEFSYSIELDSPENRKDGSIEDSDTASSSVCSENALQSKVEQFMMFIGCGGEYQQEKKDEYNALFARCHSLFAAFEESDVLRKSLANKLAGKNGAEFVAQNMDSFCLSRKGERPGSTIGECLLFVDNHQALIFEMADQLPKTSSSADSAFHRFTDKESQLLAHLRGQYEALGAAETAAPPSNNMDF